MTHLKGLLWLAAWSVWLWLGFGLAHHLPKRAGDLVCPWKHNEDTWVIGFQNGQKGNFATLDASSSREVGPSVVRIWDAATGQEVRRFDGPLTFVRFINYSSSHVLPLLVTSQQYRPDLTIKLDPDYLSVLDLRTGAWWELPVSCNDGGDLHRTRPWCLCTGGSAGNDIKVVDLQTKRTIFRWKPTRGAFAMVESKQPFFLGDHFLGVPIVRSSGFFGLTAEKTHAFEVWSLTEPDKPPRVYENVEPGYSYRLVGSRILWSKIRPPRNRQFEVFDLGLGRFIYSSGVTEGTGPPRRSIPALSSDGRRLLDGRFDLGASRLLDIETDQTLWTADWNEHAWGGDEGGETFRTKEDWSFTLFGTKREYFTWTRRGVKDGSLLLRSWDYAPLSVDDQGPLYFAEDGIRRLQFRTDWRLLAACESLLALPMFLLWTALWWRRRGRLLKAPAP